MLVFFVHFFPLVLDVAACVLHWHANIARAMTCSTSQENLIPCISVSAEACSAVLSIGDPESGRLKVNGETALFVNRSKFSA